MGRWDIVGQFQEFVALASSRMSVISACSCVQSGSAVEVMYPRKKPLGIESCFCLFIGFHAIAMLCLRALLSCSFGVKSARGDDMDLQLRRGLRPGYNLSPMRESYSH